jgi:hypothetical protein
MGSALTESCASERIVDQIGSTGFTLSDLAAPLMLIVLLLELTAGPVAGWTQAYDIKPAV